MILLRIAGVLVGLFLLLEVVIPLLCNRPIFPAIRRRRRANELMREIERQWEVDLERELQHEAERLRAQNQEKPNAD